MAGDGLDLSVVIPCLNEAGTLAIVIEKARRACEALGLSGEIVVADNGSTDGSPEIAARAGARVVHVKERGYGNALRHGARAAKGRLLVMGDADDTYDFGEMGRFVERLEQGADFVMGTRLGPGRILPGANPWLHRRVGTPALTFALNRLFGLRIRDVNCGMRGITRAKFAELDLRSSGMEFASEMLIKAAVMQLRIEEVPVTLHPDRRPGRSHLRRWSDGWRHLEFMLLHAPDQLLFLPGLVLLLLALVLSVPVSAGPVRILGHNFDFHFLFLGGAMALIGLQGIVGALLVRDVADKVLRPNRLLSAISEWLTLGRGLFVAAGMFLLGFALDAVVLFKWIHENFGSLNEPRLSVLGLLIMTVGAELAICAFLHAALKKHS
jgi:glycosyltransferase involved in cell wall biosynthesis